jgi:hypothetical protein
MATAQIQTTASEESVRAAIASALGAQRGRPVTNAPGVLVVETGSVGKAFLAGPFRDAMKMPMLISVATTSGAGGTDVGIEVRGRGTAHGFASRGVIGMRKQTKAERSWVQIVLSAVNGIPSQTETG